MSTPKFAAQNTWWKATSTTRPSITKITIVDSYTPSGTITENWDASADGDGSLMCYVAGTELIIAGNGSGEIYTNEDAATMFSVDKNVPTNGFINITLIDGFTLLNTSLTTTVFSMFNGCKKLTAIDLSSFNTENMADIGGMFNTCTSLTSLDFSNFNTLNNTSLDYFCNKCSSLKTIIFPSSFVTNKVKSFQYMFGGCSSLERLDLSHFDFSSSQEFQGMFDMCENLTSIIFPENCIIYLKSYMGKILAQYGQLFPLAMFEGCKKLKTLNCSFAIVPNEIYSLAFMFWGCSSLGQIDVSTWDTHSIKSLDHFAADANLKCIGIENWDTSSLENANASFHSCPYEELDLSKWDVSKVKFFGQMFEGSPNLKRIKGLQNWNTSAGLGFEEMFARCPKLEELNLSSFDTTHAKMTNLPQ